MKPWLPKQAKPPPKPPALANLSAASKTSVSAYPTVVTILLQLPTLTKRGDQILLVITYLLVSYFRNFEPQDRQKRSPDAARLTHWWQNIPWLPFSAEICSGDLIAALPLRLRFLTAGCFSILFICQYHTPPPANNNTPRPPSNQGKYVRMSDGSPPSFPLMGPVG